MAQIIRLEDTPEYQRSWPFEIAFKATVLAVIGGVLLLFGDGLWGGVLSL